MFDLNIGLREQNGGSKGQFNVEFFTVLILFVGFAAYFSTKLMGIGPIYIKETNKAIVRAEAYRISEMIINNPGVPSYWDVLVDIGEDDQIKRIGLSDHLQNKTNLLSDDKINNISVLCARPGGYNEIKSLIGAEHDFLIMLTELTGEPGGPRIDCGSTEFGENAALIKRLIVFDSENDGELDYGELVVQVW